MLIAARTWSPSATRHAAAAIGGVIVAAVVSQAFTLEPRYIVVFVGGTLLMSCALGLISHVRSLLLYLLAFNLVFTCIEKTLLILSVAPVISTGNTIVLRY